MNTEICIFRVQFYKFYTAEYLFNISYFITYNNICYTKPKFESIFNFYIIINHFFNCIIYISPRNVILFFSSNNFYDKNENKLMA